MTHRRTPPAILHRNDPVFTIQDLRDGKSAVVNDGTVEELTTLLKHLWPTIRKPNGNRKYYSHSPFGWWGRDTTERPSQSVHEFLKQL